MEYASQVNYGLEPQQGIINKISGIEIKIALAKIKKVE